MQSEWSRTVEKPCLTRERNYYRRSEQGSQTLVHVDYQQNSSKRGTKIAQVNYEGYHVEIDFHKSMIVNMANVKVMRRVDISDQQEQLFTKLYSPMKPLTLSDLFSDHSKQTYHFGV